MFTRSDANMRDQADDTAAERALRASSGQGGTSGLVIEAE